MESDARQRHQPGRGAAGPPARRMPRAGRPAVRRAPPTALGPGGPQRRRRAAHHGELEIKATRKIQTDVDDLSGPWQRVRALITPDICPGPRCRGVCAGRRAATDSTPGQDQRVIFSQVWLQFGGVRHGPHGSGGRILVWVLATCARGGQSSATPSRPTATPRRPRRGPLAGH